MTVPALQDDLLSRIEQVIRDIEVKVRELRLAIDAALQLLPPVLDYLRNEVLRAWARCVDLLNDLWNWLRPILARMGSPWTLSETANRWTTTVGGPVSSQVGLSQVGQLLTDDRWEGAAANAYRDNLPAQRAALNDVGAVLIDALRGALDKIARAISTFWASIFVTLVTLAGTVVTALGATGTIVGLPAAPVIIATGVIGAAAALTAGAVNLYADAVSGETALLAALENETSFPHGDWPEAVTA